MDQNEIKIIKTAILNEIEGEKFYVKAAHDTRDQDTSKAFLHLAEDEKRHQTMLRQMLSQLMSEEDIDIVVDNLSMKGTPSPQIFAAARNMDTDNAMEISVFHIAIMMEKASVDYYRKAAQDTSLPNAQTFYERLADWELEHLAAMETIYDSLTEDWWDKQSYSPA